MLARPGEGLGHAGEVLTAVVLRPRHGTPQHAQRRELGDLVRPARRAGRAVVEPGSAVSVAAVAATAVPAIAPAATRPAPSTTRRRVRLIERSPPSGNNSTRRDAADAQLVGRS